MTHEFKDVAGDTYLSIDASQPVVTIDNPRLIEPGVGFHIGGTDPVLVISAGGKVTWNGREVVGDEEFKKAMMDLNVKLQGINKTIQPAQEPVGFTSEESIRALKESGVSVQVYASRGTWFDEPLYTRPAPAMPTHEAIYETIINWDEGGKRSRRELARRIEALYTRSVPPQPALSESVIEELAVKHEAFGFGRVDAKGFTTHGFDPCGLAAFAKELVEAHCRGGANK